MRVADFDFELPEDQIAQHPLLNRDESKLLVFNRADPRCAHHQFLELPELLRDDDVLIFNDSKVIPARLRAINPRTKGRFEILLIEEAGLNHWWAMMKPGKRARVGTMIQLISPDPKSRPIFAEVLEVNAEGHRRLQFTGVGNLWDVLDLLGEMPLPPYIHRAPADVRGEDVVRYQTVYARSQGSVAAPTAGLHFTTTLLDRLRTRGIETGFLTLHVGLGTFAPIKADVIDQHIMHEERFVLSEDTVQLIQRARRENRRIVAVGTTTVRVLESVAAQHQGELVAGTGTTNIFIYPPYHFRVVDALITNFHLPRSTLLMLVSAFSAPGQWICRDMVRRAYAEAVKNGYRFFSYGDAMLLT